MSDTSNPIDQRLFAFVDETGNSDLDTTKSGASNLFICTAVIINERHIKKAEKQIQEISKKHFSGAEIKSSKIGKKGHPRRERILLDIINIDFGYFSVVFDKSRIKKDSGLQFKPSFYKYTDQLFYRKLQHINNLIVFADRQGSEKFMESFESYFAEKGIYDLFKKWSHNFADFKEQPLLQLADFVSGTLNWCFDPEKQGLHSKKFRDLLKPKEIGLYGWPILPQETPKETPASKEEWDNLIHIACRNRVVNFINKNEDHDIEYKQMQAAILRHLLFHKEYEEKDAIFTHELMNHLFELGYPECKEHEFRSKIIGPLRDKGIVLAGNTEGYQLVTSIEDVNEYVRHDKNIIEPMLSRLQKARDTIKVDTNNQFDILSGSPSLKMILEAFIDFQVAPPIQVEFGFDKK